MDSFCFVTIKFFSLKDILMEMLIILRKNSNRDFFSPKLVFASLQPNE